MKDLWHKLTNWIDHNRWSFGSLVAIAAMIALMSSNVSCYSKTASLNPWSGKAKVTASEFEREAAVMTGELASEKAMVLGQVTALNEKIEALNRSIELGQADLQRQDELRAEILETIGAVATSAATGGLNPAALIPVGIGLGGLLLGIGARKDNKRKDAVIEGLKAQ